MRDAVHELRHASRAWLAPRWRSSSPATRAADGCCACCAATTTRSVGERPARRARHVGPGQSAARGSDRRHRAVGVGARTARRRRQHAVTMLLVAGWFQFWALVLTAAAASARRRRDRASRSRRRDPSARRRRGARGVTVTRRDARPPTVIGKLVADAMWLLPRRRKMTRDEMRAAGVDEQARLSRCSAGPRIGPDRRGLHRLVDRRRGRSLDRAARRARRTSISVSSSSRTSPAPSPRGCRSCRAGWAQWRSRCPRCSTISASR